jgi:hypothetical protein
MIGRWNFLAAFGLLLASACQTAVADVVVYDNTSNFENYYLTFYGTDGLHPEAGDQITLAGTARTVTQFDVLLLGLENVAADVTVRFYKNDAFDGAPGTMLFARTVPGVHLNRGQQLTLSVPVPGIEVPDTFTWTLGFNPPDRPLLGLLFYDPPTIGSSEDFYWFGVPGFFWERAHSSLFISNLAAHVTAVPEPSALALLASGGLGLLGYSWYRRQRAVASR